MPVAVLSQAALLLAGAAGAVAAVQRPGSWQAHQRAMLARYYGRAGDTSDGVITL